MQILKDKVAVVTGGTMGLGKSICEEFIKEGAKVMTCSRYPVHDMDRIDGVLYHIVDLALPSDVSQFSNDILNRNRRVDILVNNAGIYHRGNVLEMDANMFSYTMEVNVSGVFRMCKYFLQGMIENNYGRIINVSSGIVLTMKEGRSAYTASKAAVNALTFTLAKEVMDYDIKVNCMCPGRIRSRMDIDNKAKVGPEAAIPTVMWLSALPKDGPTGEFWRNLEKLPKC